MPNDDEGSGGVANAFVVVALVAMLLGAVLLLAARDPFVAEVPVGASTVVFEHEAADWLPVGDSMRARVFAVGNVTVTSEETGGTNKGQIHNTTLTRGQAVVWTETAFPGESWTLTVTNNGNETARVTGAASCLSCYWAGGAFVFVGILGFVFYRLGMRRS